MPAEIVSKSFCLRKPEKKIWLENLVTLHLALHLTLHMHVLSIFLTILSPVRYINVLLLFYGTVLYMLIKKYRTIRKVIIYLFNVIITVA